MATPFAVQPGDLQQRVPTVFEEDAGFAFELGHRGHLDVRLASGDRHDLTQVFTVDPGLVLVRVRVRIEAAPVAVPWEFSARLNGTQQYARTFSRANQVLILNDIALRLLGNEGMTPNTLVLRLRRV